MVGDKNTMFNLKLRASVRKKFKYTAHDNGTTMQAVLSAFVESYVENPGKFRIKMEVKSMSKPGLRDLNMSMNPVKHGIDVMKNIEVRSVIGDSGPTGEFHIKPLNSANQKGLLNYIKTNLSGVDSGIVDPSGELGLDYSIYIIVKDEMQKEIMPDFFKKADLSINQ